MYNETIKFITMLKDKMKVELYFKFYLTVRVMFFLHENVKGKSRGTIF